jgi:carboxypeptidase C (cathepsin A)
VRRPTKRHGVPYFKTEANLKKPVSIITFIFLIGMMYPSEIFAKKAPGHSPEPDSSVPQAAQAESLSVTQHSITIKGSPLQYTATAGRLHMSDSAGKFVASIFFTSYMRKPVSGIARRPITFAFNGGPGASSVWLHLGIAGPKRVPMGQGTSLPKIDTLIDNRFTWLTSSDLVFFDPIGTGYSRAAPNVKTAKFYTVDGDIEVAAEFIRMFLTRFERWTSPLFIAGESYGTTRAAVLSDYLQSEKTIIPEGIILLSSALDFQTFSFDQGNDLPCVLILPSYTAAAWYHGRLAPERSKTDLANVISVAEKWANREYLPALYQGVRLVGLERKKIIDSLAGYTGLSASFIEEHNLRISQFAFAQQLLSDQDSTIGILDGRVSSIRISRRNPFVYRDVSLFITAGPYTALINDYLRRDLGFITPLEYVFLSEAITEQWQWIPPTAQGYLNVSPQLKKAMSMNTGLRVFTGMGYYDLTTPYLAQRYVFEHLNSDSSLLNRVTLKHYATGHQIYTSEPELEKLTDDLKAFFSNK